MKQSCILIVTRRGHLSAKVKSCGLNVAKRLELRLLVAYINTMPLLSDGGDRYRNFNEAARQDSMELQRDAAMYGVSVGSVQDSGKISKVVSRLCRMLNNLEFIIADSGVKTHSVVLSSTVPVFTVCDNTLKRQLRVREAGPLVTDRIPALVCKLDEPKNIPDKELEKRRASPSPSERNSSRPEK